MTAIVVAFILFGVIGAVTMHLALSEPKDRAGAYFWLVCMALLVATATVLFWKGHVA